MSWVFILLAGGAEVLFATCLGASNGFTRATASIGVIVFGVLAVALLSKALREVSLSVGYAAFTAIGAVGTALIGILLRDEPASPARVASLVLVVAGVVSLRLTEGSAS